MSDPLDTRIAEISELRQAVGDYITALMVDERSVSACEKAMDEAFERIAALASVQARSPDTLTEAFTAEELEILDEGLSFHPATLHPALLSAQEKLAALASAGQPTNESERM